MVDLRKMAHIIGYRKEMVVLESEQPLTYGEALSAFPSAKTQLLKVKALGHELALASVGSTQHTVRVTMSGGGVLASDAGYLYDEHDDPEREVNLHKPIDGEEHWYAFLD